MSEVNFCGQVYNTSAKEIVNVLNKIIDKEKIKLRNKTFWDEINYEDKNLEIYFQSSQNKSSLTDENNEEYQVNGEFFTANKELAKAFLEKLGNLFSQQNIKYDFEYYEETEDGEQIGDSYTIRHPNF